MKKLKENDRGKTMVRIANFSAFRGCSFDVDDFPHQGWQRSPQKRA